MMWKTILFIMADRALDLAGRAALAAGTQFLRTHESAAETQARLKTENAEWAARARQRYANAGLPEPTWLQRFPR